MIDYDDIYDHKIDHIYEGTLRDSIVDYIARYKNLPTSSGFKEWLGNRTYPLGWMIKTFGKNFEVTPEEFYKNHHKKCNICNDDLEIEDTIIQLDFSFCNEYVCGLTAHKRCFRNIDKHLH